MSPRHLPRPARAVRGAASRTIGARASVAACLTAALVLAGLVAPAASASTEPLGSDAVAGYRPIAPSVPAVDSQAGRGASLSAGAAASVVLPGLDPAGADRSALVRLSTFGAAADTLISASGAPALSVAAGGSGSSTVLLPVAADGSVSLSSSADASIRVETIATFAGDAAVPGSVVALAAPVTRTTSSGSDSIAVGTTATPVGVVGLGGVPSTDVRAAFVTATVTLSAPGTVELGGEALALPVGTSSISTVVFPDDAGSVELRSTATGTARVDVRGWLPDTAQSELDSTRAANVTGSFVPTDELGSAELPVSAGSPAGLPDDLVELVDEDEHVLALVSGTAAAGLTVVSAGSDPIGRSAGVVVDPTTGLRPQLVLLDADDPALSIRRGASTLDATVLGTFVGAEPSRSSSIETTITSPAAGSTVDFAESGGVVELAGTVDLVGGSLASVVIESGDTLVGSPAVSDQPGDVRWSARTSVPESGEYTFTVTATDRSGRSDTASVTVEIVLPDADDVVLLPEVQALSDPDPSPIAAITPTTVDIVCALEVGPGGFITASSLPNAPEGFIRQVLAVDKTADGWRLHTRDAKLDEFVLQAAIDETFVLGTGAEPQLDLSDTAEEAGVDEIVEGDELFVWTSLGAVDESELTPVTAALGAEAIDIAPQGDLDGTDGSGTPATDGADASVGTLDPAAEAGLEVARSISLSVKTGVESGGTLIDASRTDGSDTKVKIKAKGGAFLSATATTTLTFLIKADFSVDWTWGGPKVKVKFETSFGVANKVAFAIDTYGSITKQWKTKLGSVKFPPIPIYLGVPLTVNPEMDFSVSAKISATAKLRYENSNTSSYKVGVRCTNDGCSKFTETPKKSADSRSVGSNDSTLSASGAVEASVGPELALQAKIAGAVGPQITAGLSLGGTITLTGSETVAGAKKLTGSLEVFLEASAGIGIVVEVPVFDITIIDWTAAKVTQRFSLAKVSLSFGLAAPDPTPPGDGGPGGSSGPRPDPGDDGPGGGPRDAIDLMLVIDTTGSMASYIASAVENARGIVAKLKTSATNPRVGLVQYRDYGDPFTAQVVQPLTSDLDALDAALGGLSVNGGGDWPEAVYSGVVTALASPWRADAARALVVIGDAPAHDPEEPTKFTGSAVSSFLTGGVAVCLPAGGSPIVGGPSLPSCSGSVSEEFAADAASGAAYPTTADATAGSEALPVGLYGITTDYELETQLAPLAEASGGLVASVDGAGDVGDAIIDAIDDLSAAPTAYFEWEGPVTTTAPVTFSAAASLFEGEGASYRFDFGDGSTPVTGTAASVEHTFASTGSFTVTVSVTDDRGRTSQASATVVVGEAESGWTTLDPAVVDPASGVRPGGAVTVSVTGVKAGAPVALTLANGTGYSTVGATDGTATWVVPIAVSEAAGELAFTISAPATRASGTGIITVLPATVGCPV